MNNDKNFEIAYEKLKEPEGGYTDGKNQIRDEATNMGIKQSTLDKYIRKNQNKCFPMDVKNLRPEQAREIYKNEYWDNTEIPNIKNERIRNAVFDMNVMGPVAAARAVQGALNSFIGAGLRIDGVIGCKTIDAINSIPSGQVPVFMDELKITRIKSLQKMKNWPTAKGGWTRRTNNY